MDKPFLDIFYQLVSRILLYIEIVKIKKLANISAFSKVRHTGHSWQMFLWSSSAGLFRECHVASQDS